MKEFIRMFLSNSLAVLGFIIIISVFLVIPCFTFVSIYCNDFLYTIIGGVLWFVTWVGVVTWFDVK